MQSLEIFRKYDVVLCDIDGVLHTGRDEIEGVPALCGRCSRRARGCSSSPTTAPRCRSRSPTWLGQIGLEIPTASLITAGEALVDHFAAHDLGGAPILNVGNEPAAEYIRRAGGVPIPAAEARKRYREARAVVIGSSRQLDKEVLDAACNAIYLNHVPVVCTNPDVFTPTSQGEITLVAGALANLFERELGIEIQRLGKPHRPIFDLAMRRVRQHVQVEKPRVLVVDDNLESGIAGGARMGFDTLLVLTGWHRSRSEAEVVMQRLNLRPTYILESVVS